MFQQLVLARVADMQGMRRHWERWQLDLAPVAAGWLGSTGGVTGDRRLVLAARFESEEAAVENARRPEQVAWWSATGRFLDGPPTFIQTADVTEQRVGDVRAAGFVQMMRAAVRDRARFEAVETRIGPAFVEHRPDYLGGYRLWFGDATLVALDYFRSEADARAGEATEMPDELATSFQEWGSLVLGPEWYDLPDPWLATRDAL